MLLWFVAAYLAVSLAIGLAAATKVHNARDYVAAGRNLPMVMVLAMVFATWFGAETVLGISGTFLDEGFRGLISDPLGAALCLVLFGLVFARPLYRMNLMTLGDFFRARYSHRTELVLSICIVLSYLGWVAAQMTALGLVFNVISGGDISIATGTVIGASVVIFYTLFGGMWSVAVTTFVQMILIIIGLLYIAWTAGDMAGGVGAVIAKADAEGKFAFLPSADLLDILAWVAALLTLMLGSVPQQDVFQRVNAAKNEKVAVWGTTLGGIGYFFFAAVPLFIAYSATIIDPAMVESVKAQDSQLILPTLVMNHMGPVAQIIFFGALLSVIMSTASGTLLAPSVTFSENIVKHSLKGKLSDDQLLWITRGTVLAFGILVTWYATSTSESIHGMVENAYRVTLAGAFVPLAAGLFWKRANNLGVTLSIAAGLGTWILFEFIGNEDIVEPHLIGLLASIIGMVIGGYLGKPTTHANVVGQPQDTN